MAGRRSKRAFSQTGPYRPHELKALTDALVEDPRKIYEFLGVVPGGLSAPSPNDILALSQSLDAAREFELDRAPSIYDHLINGVGSAVAVGTLGVAFVGPIAPVVAATALVLGGIGGAIAFWVTGDTIRRDLKTEDRLRAIQQAQELLLQLLP